MAKKLSTKKRIMKMNRLIVLAAALTITASTFAQVIDNINYYLNDATKEAEIKHFSFNSFEYNSDEDKVVTNDHDDSHFHYKGEVKIPESVTYKGVTYKVTSIGNAAFLLESEMTSVTIPNTIENIGNEAFLGCDKLTSIYLPASVKTIGVSILSDCTNLESIVVDKNNKNFYSNGSNAIIDAKNNWLIIGCKNSIIPNTVTKIMEQAFWDCVGLTSIVIPNNVKNIDESAFSNCINLKSITLPDNLETIENGTFKNCESLESISLPSTLTLIYADAFNNCNSLKEITIPASVNKINTHAFEGCTSLTTVTNLSTKPQSIYSHTFSVMENLIVPKESEEAYRNAPIWKHFTNIIGKPTPTTDIATLRPSEGNKPTVSYNLSGQRFSSPQKGVNIVNGKKIIRKKN